MQEIDSETGEILKIHKGELYSALPIPAYKLLARTGEHIAKDILVCLISFMGKGNRCVFPSYDTITKYSGRGRESVASGIRTLEEYGFIKKYTYRVGKQKKNKYYIQDSCYTETKMNKLALSHAEGVGRCGRCNAVVNYGNVGVGAVAHHHYGCGGKVWIWNSAARKVPPIGGDAPVKEFTEQLTEKIAEK